MRKAFDANIPKLRPRLRSAVDGTADAPVMDEDGPGRDERAQEPAATGLVTVTESPAPMMSRSLGCPPG